MKYWIIKTDPDTYSWTDLIKDKSTIWDGVRNYQARNNLREMKTGDKLLFYHSGEDKEVYGTAKVIQESFQDPTTDDKNWLAVKIEIVKALKNPVSLKVIKSEKKLQEMALIKNSRLSVLPLTKEEFDIIIDLSK